MDASEQHGHHYLCVVTDGVTYDAQHSKSTSDRLSFDYNRGFQRLCEPFGCLGFGETDTVHKLKLLLHGARMRTGSSEALLRWR
eukprot:4387715-Alexandrium_andersonii.AAC.1